MLSTIFIKRIVQKMMVLSTDMPPGHHRKRIKPEAYHYTVIFIVMIILITSL